MISWPCIFAVYSFILGSTMKLNEKTQDKKCIVKLIMLIIYNNIYTLSGLIFAWTYFRECRP